MSPIGEAGKERKKEKKETQPREIDLQRREGGGGAAAPDRIASFEEGSHSGPCATLSDRGGGLREKGKKRLGNVWP